VSLSHYDAPDGSYTSSIPPGMAAFRRVVADHFGFGRTEVVRDRSRCNSTRSEHCECGACDFFTSVYAKGRPVFEWAAKNADALGVQSVIFWRRVRGFGNPTERDYTGPSPHTDHVHIGLNRAARRELTEAKVRALLPDQPEEDDLPYTKAQLVDIVQEATKPLADRIEELEKVLGVGQPYARGTNVMKALMVGAPGGGYIEEIHQVAEGVRELLNRRP
jgi:hypothetical protein